VNHLSSRAIHNLVTAAGLLLAILGTFLTNKFENQLAQERFATKAAEYHSVIQSGLHEHLAMINAVEGLFDTFHNITESEFINFIEKLRPLSGNIDSIQWLPDLSPTEGSLPNLDSFTSAYSSQRTSRG
jgi:CHASE1-domain containing sensor protein